MKNFSIIIDESSNVPKYQQIVNQIKSLIKEKELLVGSTLPSIRQICLNNNLSQETVMKAYHELKEKGIIEARQRQGYFVQNDNVDNEKNIFLLFDELSEYKKTLYHTIREGLADSDANLKVFFHHCDIDIFETLIRSNIDSYNMFVIMPFTNAKVPEILDGMKGKDIVLLDRSENLDLEKYNYIVQDFNDALFNCLLSASDRIKKYKSFVLVFPDTDSIASNAFKAPREIRLAFSRFCHDLGMDHQIVSEVDEVHQGQAFFFVDDGDMVKTIEKAKEKDLVLGEDIGVISYNEFPLKRVVADGITVISTDFKKMGEELVNYLLEGSSSVKSIIPTTLLLRNSL
jgi:DNA-binding transcriptional regulator YhcF (GntR family)